MKILRAIILGALWPFYAMYVKVWGAKLMSHPDAQRAWKIYCDALQSGKVQPRTPEEERIAAHRPTER